MLDAGPDLFVGSVVFLIPGRELGLTLAMVVRDDEAGALVAAVSMVIVLPTAALAPDSSQPRESWRLPGRGRPTATIWRMSASMTT